MNVFRILSIERTDDAAGIHVLAEIDGQKVETTAHVQIDKGIRFVDLGSPVIKRYVVIHPQFARPFARFLFKFADGVECPLPLELKPDGCGCGDNEPVGGILVHRFRVVELNRIGDLGDIHLVVELDGERFVTTVGVRTEKGIQFARIGSDVISNYTFIHGQFARPFGRLMFSVADGATYDVPFDLEPEA